MSVMTPRMQAEAARTAARALRLVSSEKRNAALLQVAEKLSRAHANIREANEEDLAAAERSGRNAAFLDRLTLTPARIDALASSVREVALLPDPLNRNISRLERDDGLIVERVSVPIGVIAMIFEARPGVVVESSILCMKAGNASILRCGSEAEKTAEALGMIISAAFTAAGIPAAALQLLQDKSYEAISELVRLEGLIDLVIPRGGEKLIRRVTEDAKVPVLKHYKGVCHAYIHESANLEKAAAIVINGKCQRPGVCNALETLLVDEAVAPAVLASLGKELLAQGVEILGDQTVLNLLPGAKPASEEDWAAEYLDLILAVRVVPGIDEAISHIERYGSQHSDSIIAKDPRAQTRFLREVDSAAVFVNSSTRLCDGSEFGLGAEIGISTDKLHARGPMGLEELTTYQWRIRGNGHVRG